jgi:hypothetical protein
MLKQTPVKQLLLALLTITLLAGNTLQARTKLVALPDRARMMVNLQDPQYTLVVEERTLALSRGSNQIDFSWQGVQIDSGSIQIQLLTQPDKTNILSVTYPPNENALVWQLFSPESYEERVRIYYLLYGVDRTTEYRITAKEDESSAHLQAYFTLLNRSGENLEEAELISNWPKEFQRTILSGEARKLTTLNIKELPITKAYYCEPAVQTADADQKIRARMFYEFQNDEDHQMGNVLLPFGKYRIFQNDPQGSNIFVGEDNGKALPVGEKQELFLGMANDIVVKRVTYNTERKNIRRNNSRRIVAFDEEVTMRYTVDNFKDEAVKLVIKERMNDYWRLDKITGPESPEATRENNRELLVTLNLPAETEEAVYELTYTRINQLN